MNRGKQGKTEKEAKNEEDKQKERQRKTLERETDRNSWIQKNVIENEKGR
jgi:hypothetical protein